MSGHVEATLNVSCNLGEDGKQQDLQPQSRRSLESNESGHIALLDKTEEFFQICDSEGKGFITSTDMRRLHKELPLTAEELDNVFDSLDLDKNGYLTLEEFSSGFSQFLHGRRISVTEDFTFSPSLNVYGDLHQSQWNDLISENEEEEERHFRMLMDSLGARDVFEDPTEVRSLWTQLRKDEPHLLSNFEEFLARVTYQIKDAQHEKKEMESVLKRNTATHDTEIRRLYEEMDQQINNEKDRAILKDSASLHLRSYDLQQQLRSKEQDLDLLFQKQRRLERECHELHSEHQESRLENVKLKMTNEELSRELSQTCQELTLAQEQLELLQERASRLQEEREMEMYRTTEGLQREKQSLMKQLELLRETNKHLTDERDISNLKRNNSMTSTSQKQRESPTSIKYNKRKSSVEKEVDKEEVTLNSDRKSLVHGGCTPFTTGDDGKAECSPPVKVAVDGGAYVEDAAQDGWPLRRVISIEEDHLPYLLQGNTNLLLHHQTVEEEEPGGEEEGQDPQLSSVYPYMPSSARGQPVGKETLQQAPAESSSVVPQCLFKVILVGNSSVGKTALLRRFCDGHFHSATSATVGIDYSIRTLNLGDSHVALQLWDTAGQERYRSITKQFFRKADGVVIIYDITVRESFRSVSLWLASLQEAVGEPIPVMLLGNKSDKEDEREVQTKEAEMLAQETHLMFSECSAYNGDNVLEAMTHLARVLREQEDNVRVNTVRLVDQPVKKKACCK